jgi:hypothetical protein
MPWWWTFIVATPESEMLPSMSAVEVKGSTLTFADRASLLFIFEGEGEVSSAPRSETRGDFSILK